MKLIKSLIQQADTWAASTRTSELASSPHPPAPTTRTTSTRPSAWPSVSDGAFATPAWPRAASASVPISSRIRYPQATATATDLVATAPGSCAVPSTTSASTRSPAVSSVSGWSPSIRRRPSPPSKRWRRTTWRWSTDRRTWSTPSTTETGRVWRRTTTRRCTSRRSAYPGSTSSPYTPRIVSRR